MFAIIHTIVTSSGFHLMVNFIYYSAPIWVTFILAVTGWNMWLAYIRARFFAEQDYVLLEIKLPKEIFKSPLSMEFLYNALYMPFGEEKLKVKFRPFKITNEFHWKGSVRPWFSLELCAIDGKLHFYIWGRRGFRSTIEAQLYSQFPGIEIYEVPDYTLPVVYDPAVNSMWAGEFELTKADPFPIKTYVDYGMDKNPKDEYKIDPLTPLVEFMGSLTAGHQAWIQILITAHKATDYDKAAGKMVDLAWSKGAEEEVKKIFDKAKPPKAADGSTPSTPPRSLSEGEKEVVTALERSVSKYGFDTGIRAIYVAPKDTFNKAVSGGISAGLRHFNSNNLNGFKGQKPMERDDVKERALFAYKNRGYFWNEFKNKKIFVLNTEELATIYHFPNGVVASPGLDRIGSRKAEAPSNLPI